MASGCQATYKKQPGMLQLARDALEWTPQGQPTPSLSLPTSNLSALFASKPGGPRVMLKVVLSLQPAAHAQPADRAGAAEDSHNFTFVSPTNALADRDWFKDQLSQHIARNRERDAQQASVQAAGIQGSGNSPAAPGAAGSATPGPGAGATGKGKGKEADASRGGTPSAGTPTPGAAGATASAQATTFRLRKLVLQADPTLLQLHRDLVLTGEITETEFWAGRQDLIDAVAAEQGLVKGKSGEMVDPKTVTGQNGEVTVKITPALIRDIFEEFPVVLRAYNDNVPDPVRNAAAAPIGPQVDEIFTPRSHSSTKRSFGLATSSRNCSTGIELQTGLPSMRSKTTPSLTSISARRTTVRRPVRGIESPLIKD